MSTILNRRNALLGWVVWLVAKRQLRKKAKDAVPFTAEEPRRGRLVPLLLSVAAAVGLFVVWRKLRGRDAEEWRATEPVVRAAEPAPFTPSQGDDIPPAA